MVLCCIPLGVVLAESYKVPNSVSHFFLLLGYNLFAINETLLYAYRILENIMSDVHDFMGKADQYDDITLLVLSVVS